MIIVAVERPAASALALCCLSHGRRLHEVAALLCLETWEENSLDISRETSLDLSGEKALQCARPVVVLVRAPTKGVVP